MTRGDREAPRYAMRQDGLTTPNGWPKSPLAGVKTLKGRMVARGGMGVSPAGRAATSRWRVIRFLTRERSGATAVEFAFVGIPFFLALFAILEVAFVFLGDITLSNAVTEAARLIRTGQAQDQGFDQAQFKEAICQRVAILPGCRAKLQLDVRTFNEFAEAQIPPPLDEEGNLDNTGFAFQMGSGGDIVLVRVYYEWDLIAKIPGIGLGNMGNGNHLLSSVALFRNEPF